MNVEEYKNKLPYGEKNSAERAAYRAEEQRLAAKFYDDLAAQLGLTGHPKFGALLTKAWERGHSSGHLEVICEAEDLAELIR